MKRNTLKISLMSILFTTILILLSDYQVLAMNITDGEIEISQTYLDYLNLTEEEKEEVIVPEMYDIPHKNISLRNPFRLTRIMRSSIESYYSLQDIIPENMVIKNQESTSLCWAFASLASLESHLALQDYKNNITPVFYDFSERHMDYATTSIFLDGKINKFGFNRTPGSKGGNDVPIAYLTNGMGAINETEMEFSTNTELIDISEIQNKEVATQVNDIIKFPSYSSTDDTTQIINQMKEHIMNYGAIKSNIYNIPNEVGAIYCNDSTKYKVNHSVAIIGWDDDYSVENFNEENRPANSGAWIAKNSFGTDSGNQGFVYISYEDANVYKSMVGIENAQTNITYENIYQYDELGGYLKYKTKGTNKIYLAQEFEKKTTENEYLTQVSVNAPEAYECKVYINPNGTSKDINDLQQVELKTGETQNFEAGYHTIEFEKPIKIEDEFVVVLEITGSQENLISILVEVNYGEFYTDSKYDNDVNHIYDTVTISESKCFIATEEDKEKNEWADTSKLYEATDGKLPNFDTTIKAFTTSNIAKEPEIEEPEIKDPEIGTPDIEETEQEKPTNSTFVNVEANTKKVRAYYISDTTQKEKVILDIEISNIIRAVQNEQNKYYYYLSSNPNEKNITAWIPILDTEFTDDGVKSKLEFEIDSMDILNYEQLESEDDLYIYIKEVSEKNNMSAEYATNAIELNVKNMNIEEYIDGNKKNETNFDEITDYIQGEKIDNTIANQIIPNAGHNMIMVFLLITTAIFIRIIYVKYRDIEII